MEVLLEPGQISSIINVITDALVAISGFGLISSLNAYGRWKLYKNGKADKDLHFHETTIIPAILNAFRLRKSSRMVALLLCIQAIICAIIISLKAVAPIGVSQSKKFRVSRNQTLKGDSLCNQIDPSYPLAQMGEAKRRILVHFESGGDVLSVGRTGKNSDALLLEDKNSSYGLPFVVNEFNKSIKIKVSAPIGGVNISLDVSQVVKKDPSSGPTYQNEFAAVFNRLHYPDAWTQYTEGPLYIIYLFRGVARERYAFIKCSVPILQLQQGHSSLVTGACNVANIERDTIKSGILLTISPVPQLLRDLDQEYKTLSISNLGHRWIMLYDTAKILGLEPCGDSYIAYLPFSEVSEVSIIIVSALGSIAAACMVAAIFSFGLTRRTFDWNGSYERIINLAGNSDSIQLRSCWDISTNSKANVVITPTTGPEIGYTVQVVPKGFQCTPVPKAEVKLIK
ncbi:unnamed protein product [Agarophyton chilense]